MKQGMLLQHPLIKSLILFFLLSGGCSADNARTRYLLAEKLWFDGKYKAAVAEFEKVVIKDPKGKWGNQALFRAAITNLLFLAEYGEAARKFRAFIAVSGDEDSVWEARKQLGDILFFKLENYEQATEHYHEMLRLRPNTEDTPELLFRLGRSQFFLWQFSEAVKTFKEVSGRFSGSVWAEKAAFEIGSTHLTRGAKQGSNLGGGVEVFQEAMDAYKSFIRRYPNSRLVVDAKFGIATCLEELDQLEAAYYQYSELKSSYPSPQVIKIKLRRIAERKAQQNR